MLTASDKKFIQESIKAGFQEFYDGIFEPFATANEESHERIKKELKMDLKATKEELKEDIQVLGEHIKDHEKRITKLEVRSGL